MRDFEAGPALESECGELNRKQALLFLGPDRSVQGVVEVGTAALLFVWNWFRSPA